MIERWLIVSTPIDKDMRRHTLYVKAETADLSMLVRKLGAMCGRPQRERVKPEYNYSLYLRGVTPLGLQQVEKMLDTICPRAEAKPVLEGSLGKPDLTLDSFEFEPAPKQTMGPSSEPVTLEQIKPFSQNTQEPPVVLPPAPQETLKWKEAAEMIDLSNIALPEPGKPAPTISPAVSPPPPPPPTPKETVVEDLVGASAAPPVSFKIETPPPPAPEPEAPPPVPKVRLSTQALWGAVLPLDVAYTFDTLLVGPYNRFAHAASVAVVSNPGAMYNPLFVYGAPGVGKTHLLLALAKNLQDQNPAEQVFYTTGPRLARAAKMAIASGRTEELDNYVKKSRALIIDDVHLLAVSDQNQALLANILHHYFSSAKAVAMSSVYPPRVLGGLEESLKFQLSSGWSVEMKTPNPDLQKSIITASLTRTGLNASDAEEKDFQARLGTDFFELGRWMRRLKALNAILKQAGKSGDLRDMLPLVFAPEGPALSLSTEEVQRMIASLPAPPPIDPAKAKNMAVFFPVGKEEHAKYVVQQMHAFAQQYSLVLPLRQIAAHVYDPEQLYGVPFAMGEQSDQIGADAVMTLGPLPGSGLANREGELVHALDHILSSLEIPLAWVPITRIKEANSYFRAILDLYPAVAPKS